MALTWEWNKLSGTITEINYGKEHTFNFYEGNALMIVLNEYEDENGENMYNLHWFFCDEAHAKNCLGLAKGHENMFEENSIKNITVYRDNCRQWEKIVKLFTKAFPNIEITLLPTKKVEEK